MNAKIKSIALNNFKGCREKVYYFDGKNATVSGANATGKTTIVDAFWWCLFNKDSLGNEKFSIRPLDENGKMIDSVDIKVIVNMDIDGNEVEFCKTQRQKWVKKRGSDVTELQGNENLYEIDGYPKSEKEYKSAISEIVSEDVFKMITNPTYFPSLKWKEQREILMRFVTETSDYDLAVGNADFADLLDELKKAPSTDDIKAKYQKALTEWKKKQVEIPVRIDEAEKSKVDIDVAEQELYKNMLSERIADTKAKIADAERLTADYQTIADEIVKLKLAQTNLQHIANKESLEKRQEIENKITDKNFLLKQTERTITDTENQIKSTEKSITDISTRLETTRTDWKTENSRTFDDNSLICSYCGQKYPNDKKEQLKADFESHKAKKLAELTEKGTSEKEYLEKEKQNLTKLTAELSGHTKSLDMLNTAIVDFEKQLSELPTSVDITNTEEYKALQSQIDDKEKTLAEMNNASDIKQKLNSELSELQSQLTDCQSKLTLSQRNVEIDERIDELQTEQRDISQKVADQEKMLYLLEQFIKFKMDSVSDSINSKFDGINFKLFENQLNGGLKETCELTVNGVPYGSLNNGHRIIAGLQIIKALQGLYDVRMPIFTDNAESINDFNMPEMDCQMILLKVSEDEKIKVEVM